jgi:hypothetical protein
MAARKEYAYYIRGNQVAIIEKDYTGIDDGLNYTYTTGSGIDVPSGTSNYKSPLTAVTDGLEIEYASFFSVSDEADEIPVASYLQKALVYYVKARIAEDMMDLERKEYFMREFRKMVEKHENAKTTGPRMIMPGNMAIR